MKITIQNKSHEEHGSSSIDADSNNMCNAFIKFVNLASTRNFIQLIVRVH